MKQIHGMFQKEDFCPHKIYLIDCFNDAFVWVGSKVQPDLKFYSLKFALNALARLRYSDSYIEKISLNLVIVNINHLDPWRL
jgi:hypothetical protein